MYLLHVDGNESENSIFDVFTLRLVFAFTGSNLHNIGIMRVLIDIVVQNKNTCLLLATQIMAVSTRICKKKVVA